MATAKKKLLAKRSTKRTVKKAHALVPPALGAYWRGQGGYFMGTVRGADGVPTHHLVVADKKFQIEGPWGKYGETVSGAGSHIDGAANTKAMAAAGSEIAKKALALDIDGRRDFFIPATKQQNLCRVNGDGLFDREWYWSSTQSSSYCAFFQHFAVGYQGHGAKGYSTLVRPVRTIPL